MIEIVIKDFDIKKARQLLQEHMDKRNLPETLLLKDLIDYQKKMYPKSILYQELLIKKQYSKEIIVSVLNELEYHLIKFVDSSEFKKDTDKTEPEFHLIVFGPAEE